MMYSNYFILTVSILSLQLYQPTKTLGLSINKAAKQFLYEKFQEWYTLQSFEQQKSVAEGKAIDLTLSTMKPF